MSTVRLLLLLFSMMALVPMANSGVSVTFAQKNSEDDEQPKRHHALIDFPLLEVSEDLTDITGGIGWDMAYQLPVIKLFEREVQKGKVISDGSFSVVTTGAWLLDKELNNRPLTGRVFWDVGFELAPRPLEDIPSDLFVGEIEYTDMGFWNWLNVYRAALTVEASAEAVQDFEVAYVTLGPGLRLLNLSRSGWTGLLPSLNLYFEGVFELANEAFGEGGFETSFSRLRLVQRHQLSLGLVGLDNVTLAGGYQYTRDFGQSQLYEDADLHHRFGWVADVSYAIRWQTRRERLSRLDLFARYSGGEVAPLVETDRSFTVGIRLPLLK